MRIQTSEIREGKHIGEVVWICHYLRPDLDKKTLRNIPPTKVIVRSNDELPENKTVYYSKCHFSPLSKKGTPTSKVISPVDNTGYRMRHGNELYVFTDEIECIAEWNEQVKEVCSRAYEKELNAASIWRKMREELSDMMIYCEEL